jgi:hypothetical protein
MLLGIEIHECHEIIFITALLFGSSLIGTTLKCFVKRERFNLTYNSCFPITPFMGP